MVGSIVVVSALTCVLFHSMCDLKATQINVQCNLIMGIILYEFELGHNTTDITYNICSVKSDGAVHHKNQVVLLWL